MLPKLEVAKGVWFLLFQIKVLHMSCRKMKNVLKLFFDVVACHFEAVQRETDGWLSTNTSNSKEKTAMFNRKKFTISSNSISTKISSDVLSIGLLNVTTPLKLLQTDLEMSKNANLTM